MVQYGAQSESFSVNGAPFAKF